MTETVERPASTDVARRPTGSTLVIDPAQNYWTDRQAAALVQIGVVNASNADLGVFFHQCTRTGLDPFLRQIYMIERQGKQTIQTGIDGFRLVARRAADRTGDSYEVEDTLWCGKDGQWSDVWLGDGAPSAAKAVVIRAGKRFSAVALFDEYAGRKGDGNLNSMWKGKSAHMIGKCAEALAHRKAFPQDLSGIYTDDEMSGNTIEHIPGESTPSRSGVSRLAAAVNVPPPAAAVVVPEPPADEDPPESPVDAVVVDEPPAPMPEPDLPPPPAPVELAVRAQVQRLQVTLNGFGCRDRDRRLHVVRQLVGREIETTNELTKSEASTVIDTLEGVRDREQFDDMFGPAE